MERNFSLLSTVGAVILLAGCASQQTARVDNQLVAEPDKVSLRLATAVDRASAALQSLASIEQARTPGATVSSISNAPQELKRSVSIEWTGPVEPITQRLAERAGYQFAVIGQEPPVPVVVSVKAVNKPVVDVLRDVGLQSGLRANIVVDAERRIVEVNYAPVAGG